MMGGKLNVLIAILVIVAIGILVYVFLNGAIGTQLTTQAPVQNDVVVSGIIKTGFTTSPSGINLTSQKTGQTAYATIDKNGHYSITVLGNDTYNVTIYYNSLIGVQTSKNCKSVITLNAIATSYNFSMSC